MIEEIDGPLVRFALHNEIKDFESKLERMGKLKFLYAKTHGDINIKKIEELMNAIDSVVAGNEMIEVTIAVYSILDLLVKDTNKYEEEYMTAQSMIHSELEEGDPNYG